MASSLIDCDAGLAKQEGVEVSPSLGSALELLARPEFAERVETVFVIGGGQVYAECMDSPLLSAIHLTQVGGHPQARADSPKRRKAQSGQRHLSGSAGRRIEGQAVCSGSVGSLSACAGASHCCLWYRYS